MKHFKVTLIIALVAISFSACKKEKNNDSIVGTWNAQMFVSSYEMNGVNLETDTTKLSASQYLRLILKDNNQATIESNLGDEFDAGSGYYSISGNQLTLGENADDPDKESYNYQLAGSKLVLSKEQTETDGSVTVKVKFSIHFTR